MNGITLDELTFDNRFTRELPGDPEPANFRRQVTGACYSRVTPVQVRAPRLVAHSREMAAELGLSDRFVASEEFPRIFAGNAVTSRAWTPSRCATAATSSAPGPASSGTDAPSTSER